MYNFNPGNLAGTQYAVYESESDISNHIKALIDRFNRYFEELYPNRTNLYYVTQTYNELVNEYWSLLYATQKKGLQDKMTAYEFRVSEVEAGRPDPHTQTIVKTPPSLVDQPPWAGIGLPPLPGMSVPGQQVATVTQTEMTAPVNTVLDIDIPDTITTVFGEVPRIPLILGSIALGALGFILMK